MFTLLDFKQDEKEKHKSKEREKLFAQSQSTRLSMSACMHASIYAMNKHHRPGLSFLF